MMVIPAIDLKDGRCVRLQQGDMARETAYAGDPAAVARRWEALGAPRLHVVDLNGAVSGRPYHMQQVCEIAEAVSIPVQVGGGLRSLDAVRDYAARGVRQVVVGTAALEHPSFLAEACAQFPGAIFVGIDVKHGRAALHGWTALSGLTTGRALESLAAHPVAGVIMTSVDRDGMLAGPDVDALRRAVRACPAPLIAAGGVTRVEDIRALKRLGGGLAGVIVGKALYEGALDLPAALAEARA